METTRGGDGETACGATVQEGDSRGSEETICKGFEETICKGFEETIYRETKNEKKSWVQLPRFSEKSARIAEIFCYSQRNKLYILVTPIVL